MTKKQLRQNWHKRAILLQVFGNALTRSNIASNRNELTWINSYNKTLSQVNDNILHLDVLTYTIISKRYHPVFNIHSRMLLLVFNVVCLEKSFEIQRKSSQLCVAVTNVNYAYCCYPTPSSAWEHGKTPWNPRNQATFHGKDEKSYRELVNKERVANEFVARQNRMR